MTRSRIIIAALYNIVLLFLLGCSNGSVVSVVSHHDRRRGGIGGADNKHGPVVLMASATTVATGTSTSTSSSASTVSVSTPSNSGGGGNVVFQLFGYLKDSMVRTIDGTKEMWSNHGKCNRIRAKQRDYRDKLQTQWSNNGMAKDEIKQRLKSVNGGITYDEFDFLSRGKDDRSKLLNIIFLMWGAPRFLPYALMFYPEMLPSPFSGMSTQDAGLPESRLEKLSRQRSHAAVQTLLNIERDARVVPALAKINFFGRKKQQATLEKMDLIASKIGTVLSTTGTKGATGATAVMDTMDAWIYNSELIKRKEVRLTHVPKPIIKGLASLVDGGGIPNPLSGLTPGFMTRGKLITHMKKIEDADQFLVNEQIDLTTLDTTRLVEACQTRFIGGPNYSETELRQSLRVWLDCAVIRPNARVTQTGESYNGNVARLVLLSYHALDSTRDSRSASYLLRDLYGGQMQQQQQQQQLATGGDNTILGSDSDNDAAAVEDEKQKRRK